jgi:hypothetical protein
MISPPYGFLGQPKPNFELRLDLYTDTLTNDVYYTTLNNTEYMNIRYRDGEIKEIYPSDRNWRDWRGVDKNYDDSKFMPYNSINFSTLEKTHLYMVTKENVIQRYNKDGIKDRTYKYVFHPQDEISKIIFKKWEPFAAIFYYDTFERKPHSVLLSFNQLNKRYNDAFELIKHENRPSC